MKIVVTGGNGQLGRAFQTLAAADIDIQAVDLDVLDVTNQAQVLQYIEAQKPAVVVHGAAMTQVDAAEGIPDKAYRINAVGTQNIAAACLRYGCKMVYVSTDYVFAGDQTEAYTEFMPTKPLNVYGKSKLAGEELARSICPRLFIARTAWLYGDGNNFVRTMLRLGEERKNLQVVNDQTGSPTYAKDLAQAIVALAATEHYGTYHMTNNGSCTWYEFAKEIFRQAALPVTVEAVTTEAFPREAKRPPHSVLRNYMLELTIGDPFRSWQDALADYLADEKEKGRVK